MRLGRSKYKVSDKELSEIVENFFFVVAVFPVWFLSFIFLPTAARVACHKKKILSLSVPLLSLGVFNKTLS